MDKIFSAIREEWKALLDESFQIQREELRKEFKQILNPPKLNHTVKEVAKILNVSELTVRNYIGKGYIKSGKIGRRIVISNDDLQSAISEVKSLKYKR